MALPVLGTSLRGEYERLFETCTVRPEKAAAVQKLVEGINGDRQSDVYHGIEQEMGIPWFFVAAVHHMESDRDFTTHLHNGDSLKRPTVNKPANRPLYSPPAGGYSWEESARDALKLKGLREETDWSLAGVLYQLERYNGFGYRNSHPQVLSPYLWSFSMHYDQGKYRADGVWSDTLRSKQCGAAVILRRMSEMELIEFKDQPAPPPEAGPLAPAYSKSRSRRPELAVQVEALQRWLNSIPGIHVKVDSVPGPRTSEAYRKATGQYLPGDPRGV